MRVRDAMRRSTPTLKLIDENNRINSYKQFTFTAIWGCNIKFNIHLLYSIRPKDASKNSSVRVDAFDWSTLVQYTSWYLTIGGGAYEARKA